MIILKKFLKKIPSYRHKTDIQLFDNQTFFLKKLIYHKKNKDYSLIKHKKKLFNLYTYVINKNIIKYSAVITKKVSYQFKPYKKIILCSTLSGLVYNFPGIENVNVGKILSNHNTISQVTNKQLIKGFIIFLKYVPYNIFCSNIFNLYNNKITYAKSSGTYSKLKKLKKTKKKLLLMELPSKNTILLTKNTKTYIGQNQNFKTNELIEGSWGFGFTLKKKINVRGVAMNPVDHPNGGRTKTVQPERSPWNWIAKKKK